MTEHLVSPTVWDAVKEVYSCFAPSRIPRYAVQLGGREELGRTAARTLRGFQRNAGVTNCFMNSIRKLTQRQWGIPYLWIPQLAQSPPVLHTHSPLCGQLLGHMRVASMSLYRWLVGIHKKPAQLCGIERKHTESIQHCPQESTSGYQHLTWFCRIERRHKILRISLPSKRDKKCGTAVSIENV